MMDEEVTPSAELVAMASEYEMPLEGVSKEAMVERLSMIMAMQMVMQEQEEEEEECCFDHGEVD